MNTDLYLSNQWNKFIEVGFNKLFGIQKISLYDTIFLFHMYCPTNGQMPYPGVEDPPLDNLPMLKFVY